jgi:hypothetical protein
MPNAVKTKDIGVGADAALMMTMAESKQFIFIAR